MYREGYVICILRRLYKKAGQYNFMHRDKFDILIQKYQNGELKDSERLLMDRWFDSLDSGKQQPWTAEEQEMLCQRIMADIEPEGVKEMQSVPFYRKRWIPYAAAVLLIATIGSLYFLQQRAPIVQLPDLSEAQHMVDPQDILPGGNKATLTLADGRTIVLSEAHEGIVIGDGEIRYDDGDALLADDVADALRGQYATLSIPRGGQYQVVLPDGSKVWLNAASTLKYPLRFADHAREVELEGEAYFEIASRQDVSGKHVPFLVNTPGQTVEVFGTQFNVFAYADEVETRTTLVSGQVRVMVSDTQQASLLAPGQESVIHGSGMRIHKANVASAIAWKSGIFHFEETPFPQMLKQIARWYDIDVVYEGSAPNEVFSGKMSRNVNLGVLLKFLKDSGINMRIEGKILTVRK